MRIRVIANDVATRGGRLQEVRAFTRVFSDDEKRSARFKLIEKIE